MTPDPRPTNLESAEEFDVAAKIAYELHDYVFAATLAQHAHHLRMQEKNDFSIAVCRPPQG